MRSGGGSRAPCKFFNQGTCRNGSRCRFSHGADNNDSRSFNSNNNNNYNNYNNRRGNQAGKSSDDMRKLAIEELSNPSIWQFSGYSVHKGLANVVDGDLSFEEVRFEAYQEIKLCGNCMKSNEILKNKHYQMQQQKNQVISLLQNAQTGERLLAGETLDQVKPSSSQGFGGVAFQSQNASPFGNPTFNSQSVGSINPFASKANSIQSFSPFGSASSTVFGSNSTPSRNDSNPFSQNASNPFASNSGSSNASFGNPTSSASQFDLTSKTPFGSAFSQSSPEPFNPFASNISIQQTGFTSNIGPAQPQSTFSLANTSSFPQTPSPFQEPPRQSPFAGAFPPGNNALGETAGSNTTSFPLQESFSSIDPSGLGNLQAPNPKEPVQSGADTISNLAVNPSKERGPPESSLGTSCSTITRDQEWSIAQFKAETFRLGMVPTIPPPIEFC